MSAPAATWPPAAWPLCSGCGAEIISAHPDLMPWSVIVRHPTGEQEEGGAFCLGCMIELAKRGVILHPVKRKGQ